MARPHRVVHLPRVWDDPDRHQAENDWRDEIERLPWTFKTAFYEWTQRVGALATWMRYSRPSGTTPVELLFGDQAGGPEASH